MAEELIDVLDAQGQPTGETKTRAEIHAQGLWHRDIHIYIVNSHGEVLWQKRSAIMDVAPNMWSVSVAAHVKTGAGTLETAVREAQEELGLDLSPHELELITTLPDERESRTLKTTLRHYRDVFLVKRDLGLKTLKLQPEEVAEVKWLTMDDLEKAYQEKNPNFTRPAELEYVLKLIRQRWQMPN